VTVGSVTSPPAAAAPASKTPTHHWGFAEVLSALNPLQYLPVVGTIYRAVTGDRIPEGLQIAGSLAVGVALSGPIGLVTGIATIIAERATGIDPDKIAHKVAVGLGIAPEAPPPVAGDGAAAAPTPEAAITSPPLDTTEALNQRELDRIRAANAAYTKVAGLT
jgi:hypothetical protein